jgi:PLD-like domain
MLFMLDIPHVRMAFPGSLIGNPGPSGSVRLEERLLEAANRGVDVGLLLNDVKPSVSPANTCRAVEAFFRRHDQAGRVRIARLETPQAAPIHAKVFVIDDSVAFLIGSAFAQEYFDGRRHRIDDPRRGAIRWRSSVRAPVHDVSVRIEGPAVQDLDATFELHWQAARLAAGRAPIGRQTTGTVPRSRSTGPVALQVTRTLHGNRYAGLPGGETGIFESYLGALETARDFIYIETQYFTCVEIVDALVGALRRSPDLQLIALLNMHLDIPGYPEWQRQALERLLRGLGPAADRAGIFTVWNHEPAAARDRYGAILRTHVHSKLAIIDDAWLSLGSANLDGVSLLTGEHARRWPIRARLGRLVGAFGSDPSLERASEVNITCAAAPGKDSPPDIAALRRDLWAEHLGYGGATDAPNASSLPARPEAGWLSLWRERALEKLDGLRAAPPHVTSPRILPYPARGGDVPRGLDRPDAYLRSLGIPVGELDVRRTFRSFSFREGRWR